MTNILRLAAVSMWLSRLRVQKPKPVQPTQTEPEQRPRGVGGKVLADYFNDRPEVPDEVWEDFHRELMETRERSKQ